MANITPTVSLKDTRFTPMEFKPIEYNPIEVDTSILDKSLARREERQLRANTALGQFKEKNSTYLKNLPNDVTLQNDLDKIIKEYKDPVEEAINRGDYSQAFNLSVNQGSDLYNDARFKGRLQAVDEYQKYITNIDDLFKNDKISQKAADYYKETQTFNYVPKLEADGTESKTNIGELGKLQRIVNTPVYEGISAAAFKLINPDTTNTSNSNTNSKGGSESHQKSITQVTYDDIWSNIQNLYRTNVGLREQILRDMEINKYTLEKLQDKVNKGETLSFEDQKEYENLKDRFMHNGVMRADPIEWLKAETEISARYLAYKNYQESNTHVANPEHQAGAGGGGQPIIINNGGSDGNYDVSRWYYDGPLAQRWFTTPGSYVGSGQAWTFPSNGFGPF